jgi:hypothetical protein
LRTGLVANEEAITSPKPTTPGEYALGETHL